MKKLAWGIFVLLFVLVSCCLNRSEQDGGVPEGENIRHQDIFIILKGSYPIFVPTLRLMPMEIYTSLTQEYRQVPIVSLHTPR